MAKRPFDPHPFLSNNSITPEGAKLDIANYMSIIQVVKKINRGSGAEKYRREPTGNELRERQSSPNSFVGTRTYGVVGNTYNTPSCEEVLNVKPSQII